MRVSREDLDEMLGNLLDNACKWARRNITVRGTAGAGRVELTIDDDGGGIQQDLREAVLARGVRADQTAPGFGFGLAIVRDLAEVYGGGLRLTEAATGGVRAVLVLPAGD